MCIRDRHRTAYFYIDKDDFNPRAPCGARHRDTVNDYWTELFQSTCPLRGTTQKQPLPLRRWLFQSTCPLRGTTILSTMRRCLSPYFNPRAPCGARRTPLGTDAGPCEFQSTCPLRGTTAFGAQLWINLNISIHVPLAGHDHR